MVRLKDVFGQQLGNWFPGSPTRVYPSSHAPNRFRTGNDKGYRNPHHDFRVTFHPLQARNGKIGRLKRGLDASTIACKFLPQMLTLQE